MPKIDAATVAEHRAQVQQRLVDAAEEILRSGRPEGLTAAAVTSAAGIARNSIYRYVDSVDDLLGLVLERHMPAWNEAVAGALQGVDNPAQRIVVLVTANLEQASRSGHGWLMSLGRSGQPSVSTEKAMEAAHEFMRSTLTEAWLAVADDAVAARVGAGFTRGVMEAGFRQLDEGIPLHHVVAGATAAVRGLLGAASAG